MVERALAAVTGQKASVTGAGRTDSGVHAAGQVIAFEVDWRRGETVLLRAINANLPDDIALQSLTSAPPGFHPRFDARARCYRYDVIQAEQRQPLLRHRAWQVREPLDGERLRQAAALLVGEYDFGAFGTPPKGENTVRRVYRSEWTAQPAEWGTLWTYRIEANAFLYRMVRRIVGALVTVGRGWWSVETFEAVFRRAELPAVKVIAPPQGLTLEAVRYE